MFITFCIQSLSLTTFDSSLYTKEPLNLQILQAKSFFKLSAKSYFTAFFTKYYFFYIYNKLKFCYNNKKRRFSHIFGTKSAFFQKFAFCKKIKRQKALYPHKNTKSVYFTQKKIQKTLIFIVFLKKSAHPQVRALLAEKL